MSKKIRQKEEAKSAGWITTFSDLMNLLLCFFVMLFAMSTIDQAKYEELVNSLAASIGIFDGGSTSAVGDSVISSGIDNINELNEYYELIISDNSSGNPNDVVESLEDYKQQQIVEMLQESTEMQAEIGELLNRQNIAEKVELEADMQYVQLTLNGALLFDSGQSAIKKDALELVDKIGDILKNYAGHMIEITGHTDSVPISSNNKYDDNIDLSTARAKSVALYVVNNKGIDISHIKFSGRGEYEPIASNDTEQGRALNRRVEIKIYNESNSY